MKFKQRLSLKVFMAFCFIVSYIFVTGGGNISFVVSSPEAALADGLVDYYPFNGNANYAGTGSIDEGFIEETTEEENIDDVITKKTEGENQNCANVDEQISIDIPSAEFGNERFRILLDIYNNTVDSESIYFKLNGFPEISESAVSSSFLDETLNINISCIAFNGSKYTLFLERYINPLDNEWFYWKVIKIELLAESDNTNASKFKNTKATYKPNLTPYKPSGWSDKIVVSTTTGTTTNSSTLYNTDTLYVDWAVINNGTASISTKFYTKLYVDGVEKTSWNTNSLSTNYYAYVKDYSIGKLSAGTHTIKIKNDSTGVISESNESDNEYTTTITVPDGKNNLVGTWKTDQGTLFTISSNGVASGLRFGAYTKGACNGYDGARNTVSCPNIQINSDGSFSGFNCTWSIASSLSYGSETAKISSGKFNSTKVTFNYSTTYSQSGFGLDCAEGPTNGLSVTATRQ